MPHVKMLFPVYRRLDRAEPRTLCAAQPMPMDLPCALAALQPSDTEQR